MTDRLTIALAQMNQRVGDLEGNAAAMLAMREKAAGADLLLCPELQLTGYPPEDLVLKPEFVRRTMEAAERLVDATAAPGPGDADRHDRQRGRLNYNAMLLADGGRVIGQTLKRELPNYGTFDEKRVFAPGPMPEPIEFRGVKLGVPICEDIWQEPVCAHLAEAGAEMLLVPNGSPYELDKDEIRQQLVRSRVTITGLPLVYLNRVGGQDELVFDGSSFVMHPDGELVVQMPDWDEELLVTEWAREAGRLALRDARKARARSLSRGHLPGDDGRPARLCDPQRLSRRDPRPVGRDRQRLVGGGRGRCAGAGQGVGRDAAVEIYQRAKASRTREECARLLGCRHDVIPIVPGGRRRSTRCCPTSPASPPRMSRRGCGWWR